MAFDGKFHLWFEFLPSEISGFCERTHLAGAIRELTLAGQESAIEEFCVALERTRFELSHVDVILANKRLYVSRAIRRVLIRRDEPVPGWRRPQPLHQGLMGTDLVGRRTVIHELLDHTTCSAVENRKRQRFPQ